MVLDLQVSSMIEEKLKKYIECRKIVESLEFELHVNRIRFHDAYDKYVSGDFNLRPFIPKQLRSKR